MEVSFPKIHITALFVTAPEIFYCLRDHVFDDLTAYWCTECNYSAFGTHHRYRKWLEHDLERHRTIVTLVWFCPFCPGGIPKDVTAQNVASYGSMQKLEEHLCSSHSALGVDRSNPWPWAEFLGACRLSFTRYRRLTCPLCDELNPDCDTKDIPEQGYAHLVHHMQQVALLAIPCPVPGLQVIAKSSSSRPGHRKKEPNPQSALKLLRRPRLPLPTASVMDSYSVVKHWVGNKGVFKLGTILRTAFQSMAESPEVFATWKPGSRVRIQKVVKSDLKGGKPPTLVSAWVDFLKQFNIPVNPAAPFEGIDFKADRVEYLSFESLSPEVVAARGNEDELKGWNTNCFAHKHLYIVTGEAVVRRFRFALQPSAECIGPERILRRATGAGFDQPGDYVFAYRLGMIWRGLDGILRLSDAPWYR